MTLKARQADWMKTATTAADGTFQLSLVPVGEYALTVALQGFTTVERSITVLSDSPVSVAISLELAGVRESVTVSANPTDVRPTSVTPTTLVSREEIQATPGADRTNSLDAITAFVPGAYITHDQLHIRGGHQVSWLIDGVPVPNTNIASNVGPQFDPKDIDFLEVQRGAYAAQFGDRTYGVFNVVPRSGFERNNDADVVLTAGDYRQTNDQVSVGGHSSRLAYFVSGNVNRSDLGLGTPAADVIHDRQTGGGGFGSLIFNADPANQLRLVTSLRRDNYQIPNAPDDQAAGIDDQERETDGFVNFTWAHTFRSGASLVASPFYHYNSANFEGGPNDPLVAVDEHRSQYVGAQTTITADVRTHHIVAGLYGFRQHDDQLFALTFNDASSPNLSQREQPSGSVIALFAQDTVAVTNWLTLTGGLRYTHVNGSVTEDATSPRVGATVLIPSINWVVRGFYGRFYQAPPLVTASGPLLDFVTAQSLGFIPLSGERDEEYQAGVTVPLPAGWTADADRFQTRATNYFDHNPLGNSNVFFPVTIDGALIRGTEVTLRSPRTWTAGDVHVAYSYQTATGHGDITGGLTDFSSGGGDFPLDHDQRHTLSVGGDVRLPQRVSAAVNVYYGSGFTDDGGPGHLPGHTTVNLTIGKTVTDRVSISVTALNIANSHLLIDNSLTFGGVHFNNPREVYGELRYRFHY